MYPPSLLPGLWDFTPLETKMVWKPPRPLSLLLPHSSQTTFVHRGDYFHAHLSFCVSTLHPLMRLDQPNQSSGHCHPPAPNLRIADLPDGKRLREVAATETVLAPEVSRGSEDSSPGRSRELGCRVPDGCRPCQPMVLSWADLSLVSDCHRANIAL